MKNKNQIMELMERFQELKHSLNNALDNVDYWLGFIETLDNEPEAFARMLDNEDWELEILEIAIDNIQDVIDGFDDIVADYRVLDNEE